MKTKTQILSLLILFKSLIIISQENIETKFTSLFNKKNLDGWQLKINNGDNELAKEVFVVDSIGSQIHVFKDFPDKYEFNTGKNNTHGFLFTDKEYSKYVLKFEYKWGTARINNFNKSQYDSGIFYHLATDSTKTTGLEYQIRYNHFERQNHTGDIIADNITWFTVDGVTYTTPVRGGKANKTKLGEHRAHMYSRANALNKRWNKCEIIVMGNKYVIHKLNGKIINMATNLPFSKGKIGIQSKTAEIFYRNIEIKEIQKNFPKEHFFF